MRSEGLSFTVQGKDANAIEREITRVVKSYGSFRPVRNVDVISSPEIVDGTGQIHLWEASVRVELVELID